MKNALGIPLGIPLLSTFLAAGLDAQPTGTFVDTVEVNVVEVDVVVTDRKGRPVGGLKRDDFELFVDGEQVEISNFFESNVFGERPRARKGGRQGQAPRQAEPPASTDDGQLTVVFYLDDANTFPSHRTRLLRRLEAATKPWRSREVSFMLARFVNRIEVLVPPTPDLDAILAGAASVPKGSPRAIQNGVGARRFAIRSMIDSHKACEAIPWCEPCVDNWGELLSLARQYAGDQAANTAIAADGLADLVTTLAGVHGRKALVYLTDRLPQRPGISVLDYLGNELCVDLRPTAPSETVSVMLEYNLTSRFNLLAVHANANRVTLYAVDAAGVRGTAPDISSDDFRLAPSVRNAGLRNMNAQSGLHLMSAETGGKALVNANDLSILLDDMTVQLSASYSLGFISEDPEPGQVRQISVRLAPGADKRRRVQYRRTYRDKPLDERLAERLFSVAHLGNPTNPLAASINFGGTTPLELGKKVHELTVAVSVPVESVVTLPGRDGVAPGRLRLWFVAVEDEKGVRTHVRQKMIAVGGETGVPAVDGSYRVEVAVNLPEGSYQVAAGVRDETTGVMSLLREPVAVPTPEAAATAN